MKCSGKDLMSYRNEDIRGPQDLINLICLSAVALGTVHYLGIFHGDITPKNQTYDNFNIQLLGFDIFSKIESQSLTDKYHTNLNSKQKGFNETFLPPEIYPHQTIEGHSPLAAEKIDIYCWGMSMLQFLTNMSDDELHRFTSPMRENIEGYSLFLKKVKSLKIISLGKDASHFIMKLVSKCLSFSPCSRISMKNIIFRLISSKFQSIVKLLNKDLKRKINHFIQQSSNSIPEVSPPKAVQILQQCTDPMLQKEMDELSQYFDKKDIVVFIHKLII